MSESGANNDTTDVLAALLSRELGDSRQLMNFLARKFEGPLSHRMTVRKGGGWLSKDKPVEEISFRFSGNEYRIVRRPEGALETTVRQEVHGVVLKTEAVPVDQWVRELAAELAAEVQRMNVSQQTLSQWIKE
jgi:hypothetical protein